MSDETERGEGGEAKKTRFQWHKTPCIELGLTPDTEGQTCRAHLIAHREVLDDEEALTRIREKTGADRRDLVGLLRSWGAGLGRPGAKKATARGTAKKAAKKKAPRKTEPKTAPSTTELGPQTMGSPEEFLVGLVEKGMLSQERLLKAVIDRGFANAVVHQLAEYGATGN